MKEKCRKCCQGHDAMPEQWLALEEQKKANNIDASEPSVMSNTVGQS